MRSFLHRLLGRARMARYSTGLLIILMPRRLDRLKSAITSESEPLLSSLAEGTKVLREMFLEDAEGNPQFTAYPILMSIDDRPFSKPGCQATRLRGWTLLALSDVVTILTDSSGSSPQNGDGSQK